MKFDNYAANEIRTQIERGPAEGEDFFRMRVSGNGSTYHFNVNAEQLETFAAILDGSANVVLVQQLINEEYRNSDYDHAPECRD